MVTEDTAGRLLRGTGGLGDSRFCARLSSVRERLRCCGRRFEGGIICYGYSGPRADGFFECFISGFGRLNLGGLVTSYCMRRDGSLFGARVGKGNFFCRCMRNGAKVPAISSVICFGNSNSFHDDRDVRLLGRSSVIMDGPPFSLFERCISRLIGCSGGFLVVNGVGTVACGRVFGLVGSGGM